MQVRSLGQEVPLDPVCKVLAQDLPLTGLTWSHLFISGGSDSKDCL